MIFLLSNRLSVMMNHIVDIYLIAIYMVISWDLIDRLLIFSLASIIAWFVTNNFDVSLCWTFLRHYN